MSRPTRYLTRMILFVIAVAVVGALLYPGLSRAFLANPALNGVILGAMVIGIVYSFRSVLSLRPEIDWIETFQAARPEAGQAARPEAGQAVVAQPSLLAPLAKMLGERASGRFAISPIAMRSVLDGIGARLGESREISRYLIGLLIFLGLLGTFWGLLQTIASGGDVIGDLSIESGDLALVFNDLQTGLEAPLSGMGTAFSSSLFGLGGSLVLGFLELQTSQAQNRFYNELEDWLSGAARLGEGGSGYEPGTEGMASPAYIQAMLEQTAENLDRLERSVAYGEDGRRQTAEALGALVDRLTALDDHLRGQYGVLTRLADSQERVEPALLRLAAAAEGGTLGLDDQTRDHVRNLVTQAGQIREELAAGRAQSVQEIRSEIKVLARTLAALAEEAEP